MEKQNVNLNLKTDNPVVTVITSDKSVLPEKAKQSIRLTGVLGAPSDFLAGRKTKYKDLDTHLEIYKREGKLVLVIHENEHTDHIITGAISLDKDLAQFGINADQYWTIANFKKFILARGFFFEDPAESKQMINNLNSFSAKIEKVIKEHNSNDGNSLSMLETKVEGIEVKRFFSLKMPVYQGYEKKVFKVEIGFRPSSSSVELFLYSEELALLFHAERERIVDAELLKFQPEKFSKVLLS